MSEQTKQNVVYTYNGILFSFKKEGNSVTCYNMDEPEDIMLSEISQSQKDILYDSTYTGLPKVDKYTETESRMVAARGWRKGGNGELFNSYKVSAL